MTHFESMADKCEPQAHFPYCLHFFTIVNILIWITLAKEELLTLLKTNQNRILISFILKSQVKNESKLE